MWAVGCIVATLYIGHSPFADSVTSQWLEYRAKVCDLASLDHSPNWAKVHARPKDFIMKLLQVDEVDRFTAEQALEHEWFTAEGYGVELQEQYKRSIRHWRPRQQRMFMCETFNGGQLLGPSPLDPTRSIGKKRKRKSYAPRNPIDPPYKPYARNMNRAFLPQRPCEQRPSEDVERAIASHWSKNAMRRGREPSMSSSSSVTGRTKSFKRRAHSPAAWISISPSSMQASKTKQLLHTDRIAATAGEPGVALAGTNDRFREEDMAGQHDGATSRNVFDIHEDEAEASGDSSTSLASPSRDKSDMSSKIRSAAHVIKKIRSATSNTKKRWSGSVFELE